MAFSNRYGIQYTQLVLDLKFDLFVIILLDLFIYNQFACPMLCVLRINLFTESILYILWPTRRNVGVLHIRHELKLTAVLPQSSFNASVDVKYFEKVFNRNHNSNNCISNRTNCSSSSSSSDNSSSNECAIQCIFNKKT